MAGKPGLAIALIGGPGTGKGTQAELLEKRLGLPHISTGDILRGHVSAGDEIGLSIKQRMNEGIFPPDELVNDIVRQRVQEADCVAGFVLDGYPRTVAQAELLLGWFAEWRSAHWQLADLVIHLRVDYNRVFARVSARRVCSRCQRIYSLTANPPKQEGQCDEDGATLEMRPDDRLEVLRERWVAYEQLTSPVAAFMLQAGRQVHDVDGDAEQEVVFGRIAALVSTRNGQ